MGEEYIRRIMVLGEVPSLGPVMMFDNMEDLLKWTKSGTGGDDLLEKSATVAFNGSASLHIKTRVTNAAADDLVKASRNFYQRPGQRYSLESIFMVAVNANCKVVDFEFSIMDGVTRHYPGVRYDPVNGKWQYRTGATAYSDVPGGAHDLAENRWHRLKFKVDENKKQITGLTADGLELRDLELAYYSVAGVLPVLAGFDLSIVSVGVTPPEAYFDDVLILEI